MSACCRRDERAVFRYFSINMYRIYCTKFIIFDAFLKDYMYIIYKIAEIHLHLVGVKPCLYYKTPSNHNIITFSPCVHLEAI